jgi:hypothetical protein
VFEDTDSSKQLGTSPRQEEEEEEEDDDEDE